MHIRMYPFGLVNRYLYYHHINFQKFTPRTQICCNLKVTYLIFDSPLLKISKLNSHMTKIRINIDMCGRRASARNCHHIRHHFFHCHELSLKNYISSDILNRINFIQSTWITHRPITTLVIKMFVACTNLTFWKAQHENSSHDKDLTK